jgi:hypothetical protein
MIGGIPIGNLSGGSGIIAKGPVMIFMLLPGKSYLKGWVVNYSL